MSTQIGTASDYVDLLTKLDAFLCATGHAWGKNFTGTGTGDLIEYLGTASSVAETVTLTATSSTSFAVVGSVSGSLGTATVGSTFTSSKITLKVTAGGTAYVAGDVWTINVAPPWTRLRRIGCADTRFWTTNMSNPLRLLNGGVGSSDLAECPLTDTYIEFEMVAATRVRRVAMQAPSSTATRMPTTIVLKRKASAGDAWTTVETFTKASWATSEGAVFNTATDPGEYAFWRLDFTGAMTSTAIGELDLFRDLSPISQDVSAIRQAEWAWEAPGLDGTREIICGARTFHDQPNDTYGAVFTMSRTWLDGEGLTGQPGHAGLVYHPVGASSVNYWFIVNGQRAMVVTKFGGVYGLAYLGFGLPYEPPSVHAYPAIVGAPSATAIRYSSTGIEYRNPFDPSRATLMAYYPDSAWRKHSNRYSTGGGTEGTYENSASYPGRVWPSSYADATLALSFIRDNIDGSRVLLPCVLTCESPAHVWGEFDGLFWATGFATTAEAIIRQDRFDHLVLTNLFRTTQKDFGAVRLD